MGQVRKVEQQVVYQESKYIDNPRQEKLLQEMNKLGKSGWRVQAFGWSNGFQGGWYALMTRLRT